MLHQLGKTLQIYLPEGTPSGIRIAEITTRIVQAVSVPRTKLNEFFDRPESAHIATYYLFGGDDSESKQIAYIGQTEDLKMRLKSHDAKKDFWTNVVVVISRTHSFTQAHIKWLEWHSIAQATKANRYRLDNGNAASEPFATEPMKADLQEIFETASLLLESLGYPIFKPLVEKAPSGDPEEENELWYLNGPSSQATALFTSDGFIVLKDSKARAQFTNSAQDSNFARKRDRLVEEGILKQEGDSYTFTEDYPFNSPSGAAAIIRAGHTNGWDHWKNESGRTLDEVKRQSPN